MSKIQVVNNPDIIKILRGMWADLHTFAAQFPEEPTHKDIRSGGVWLKLWAKMFPARCICIEEWNLLIRVSPPPLPNGGYEFFCWTMAAHDCIGHQLGKPLFWVGSKCHILLTSLR